MRRTALLAAIALAALACTGRPSVEEAGRSSLRRAVAWLEEQQRDDGSWRSDLYAVLRSGQAMTPFVLHALLGAGSDASAERALRFVRGQVSEEGSIGAADPDILEYPVYATSYGILALTRAGRAEDRPLTARMAAWLAGRQCRFEIPHPAHGGFPFGARDLRPGDPGYMDLAHTRRALQALRAEGWSEDETFTRARRFLALLQKRPEEAERQPRLPGGGSDPASIPFDGGFYFSPVVPGSNKGEIEPAEGERPAFFRSYATATCDGALALLAAGSTDVLAARRWLEEHPRLDLPDGASLTGPDSTAEALVLYHLAVRAEASRALGLENGWDEGIVRLLASLQRPDGSFKGRSPALMKEDDPLLATTLAVVALSNALDFACRGRSGASLDPSCAAPPASFDSSRSASSSFRSAASSATPPRSRRRVKKGKRLLHTR